MRLLQCDNEDRFSLTEFFEGNIPKKYAIPSHRWGAEEVTLADLKNGNYKKMTDTCCIDKSNAVEYQHAINSMFRWYRDATKCYVYLPDVSRARSVLADNTNEFWESSFRKSESFRRGWNLQELIAPASVDFFCKDMEFLGDKFSLERHIREITGIPSKALRGSPLSEFSVTERMSWTKCHVSTYEEDKAYSLLGIFNVYMPVIYGEGKDNASARLREAVDKASKGYKREDFSITFSLYNTSEVQYFVAREDKLSKIHRVLQGDGSRRAVVLHGLRGIGKTQLSIAYAKRHKNDYSAILWLNIKDEDSVKRSFAQLAKQISREHPSAFPIGSQETKQNLDEVVESVKVWLSLPNNTRWLMIYDESDTPKLSSGTDPAAVDIRKFLPESYQGSIITITRSSEVSIGQSIQIRKFGNVRDSMEILPTMSR
ncbi:related to beta transducin-like protein [Rhynchosporium agropyri]|uniref:Related to beta transducin-like protein n=1 Tax=Rhynchosporium agropyri TaxID=914238 RepID=A0A1E1LSY6_9HELO|nr:related to beta transducin-like protein [Rhynchosporium agropyri]